MNYKSSNKFFTDGDKLFNGAVEVNGNVVPQEEATGTIGTNERPWESSHVKEINLVNDRGDWTVIPEENYLSVRDNKTNKLYKLVLEEIG